MGSKISKTKKNSVSALREQIETSDNDKNEVNNYFLNGTSIQQESNNESKDKKLNHENKLEVNEIDNAKSDLIDPIDSIGDNSLPDRNNSCDYKESDGEGIRPLAPILFNNPNSSNNNKIALNKQINTLRGKSVIALTKQLANNNQSGLIELNTADKRLMKGVRFAEEVHVINQAEIEEKDNHYNSRPNSAGSRFFNSDSTSRFAYFFKKAKNNITKANGSNDKNIENNMNENGSFNVKESTSLDKNNEGITT